MSAERDLGKIEHKDTVSDRVRKVSVSLPESLTRRVRQRVGKGAFSRYVADAVERQIQHDELAELLAEMEAVNGPITDEELATAEKAWLEAEESWRNRPRSK